MRRALVLSTWMMVLPAVFGTAVSTTGCSSPGRTISTVDPSDAPTPVKGLNATPRKVDDRYRAAPASFERRGCCKSNGGVCGCSGGFAACCDGTASKSCGCE